MKKINLFEQKYIDLFCPFYTENLYHFINIIQDDNVSFIELKKTVLSVLKYFLDNKIMFVVQSITNNKIYIKSELENNEIIQFINKKWTEDIKYIDLYLLIWFKFENWYIDGLIKKGLTNKIDWKNFILNKNINLKKWIEENKPIK